LATGQDREWQDGPNASGDRMARLMQSYIRRVLETMMHDAHVAEVFLSVQQMLASPARLFAPDVLWRTLRPRRRPISNGNVPGVSTTANRLGNQSIEVNA
jgi:hypothetical protein